METMCGILVNRSVNKMYFSSVILHFRDVLSIASFDWKLLCIKPISERSLFPYVLIQYGTGTALLRRNLFLRSNSI